MSCNATVRSERPFHADLCIIDAGGSRRGNALGEMIAFLHTETIKRLLTENFMSALRQEVIGCLCMNKEDMKNTTDPARKS